MDYRLGNFENSSLTPKLVSPRNIYRYTTLSFKTFGDTVSSGIEQNVTNGNITDSVKKKAREEVEEHNDESSTGSCRGRIIRRVGQEREVRKYRRRRSCKIGIGRTLVSPVILLRVVLDQLDTTLYYYYYVNYHIDNVVILNIYR